MIGKPPAKKKPIEGIKNQRALAKTEKQQQQALKRQQKQSLKEKKKEERPWSRPSRSP